MPIDHDLMKSLEYKGEYGGRYSCSQCSHFRSCHQDQRGSCDNLPSEMVISGHNNVCRSFDPRIKNPSSPTFNLDGYLEYLYSDYYRPWSIDTSIIIGSARIGETIADGGKLAEFLPDKYSPWYKSYDKPYCMVNSGPRCLVKVAEHHFEIDYRLYREMSFINEDNEIEYVVHYWKDKETQRKYQREINGKWELRRDEI